MEISHLFPQDSLVLVSDFAQSNQNFPSQCIKLGPEQNPFSAPHLIGKSLNLVFFMRKEEDLRKLLPFLSISSVQVLERDR